MSKEMSMRDSLYLTDDPDESTFKYDQQLPKLPVPTIQDTIFKLLDTIKPIALDQANYKETERKALEFLTDKNVVELQNLLIQRSNEHKNWLESWWLEFAYLRSRKALIPYSNMSAPLPILKHWPIVNPSQSQHANVRLERASLSTYFQLSFWQMLREERMRPMIHKEVPWSMNQFRYLFNTVRRPGEPKDELSSYFRTAKEGAPISTEIIVMHKGYIFAIQPVTMSNKNVACILPANKIEQQLADIVQWCKGKPHGPGIGALTTHERTEWTETRNKLEALSENNCKFLGRIDKALSVLVLDEEEPKDTDQVFRLSMCGDPRNRWADKSISSIAFKNGTFGANADHTPYDGFCTAVMTHYLITSVEECEGKWNPEFGQLTNSNLAKYVEPQHLDFNLDADLIRAIGDAVSHYKTVCATVDTLHNTFEHYGKGLLKVHRLHPEAFVQCAIHAAYYKLHGKMAPAYVTASTRRYHNGRTETCRSCYPEMREFCEFVAINQASSSSKTLELLKRSVHKFQTLMNEASNGQGCDRHLLGLYLTALMEGKQIPELFDDELVQRTNNYILSTSCGGYWNVCGGVPPLVEDGYGCFYSIEDHAITICCTAYKNCPNTNIKEFYEHVEQALLLMQKILLTSKY